MDLNFSLPPLVSFGFCLFSPEEETGSTRLDERRGRGLRRCHLQNSRARMMRDQEPPLKAASSWRWDTPGRPEHFRFLLRPFLTGHVSGFTSLFSRLR